MESLFFYKVIIFIFTQDFIKQYMNFFKEHTFHIPVLGIGYSLDTPVKVAPYGISSVISLVDDALIEDMRKFYCEKIDTPFQAISEKVEDFRAKRITAYLNLVMLIYQI